MTDGKKKNAVRIQQSNKQKGRVLIEERNGTVGGMHQIKQQHVDKDGVDERFDWLHQHD
jgi:hypothetical protein